MVIDVVSNSVLVDAEGAAFPTTEIGGGKVWHIIRPDFVKGSLREHIIKNVLDFCGKWQPTCQFIVCAPFPRYLNGPCCSNLNHMRNLASCSSKYLEQGTAIAAEIVEKLLLRGFDANLLSYEDMSGFEIGEPECKAFFVRNMREDNVHLTRSGCSAIASRIAVKIYDLKLSKSLRLRNAQLAAIKTECTASPACNVSREAGDPPQDDEWKKQVAEIEVYDDLDALLLEGINKLQDEADGSTSSVATTVEKATQTEDDPEASGDTSGEEDEREGMHKHVLYLPFKLDLEYLGTVTKKRRKDDEDN